MQNNQTSEGWTTGLVILLLFFIGFGLKYQKEIETFRVSLNNFVSYFVNLGNLFYAQIIVKVLIVIFLFWLLVQLVKLALWGLEVALKPLTDRIDYPILQAIEIKSFLFRNLQFESEMLKENIIFMKNKISICKKHKTLRKFIPEIEKRLLEAVNMLSQKEKEERLKRQAAREKHLKESIEALEEEKRLKEQNEMERKLKLLDKLEEKLRKGVIQNQAFLKKDLTNDEITVLLENSYIQKNEYDLLEKKVLPVLIRPIPKLYHSATHIFLVWSIRRFLETIKGIDCIEENLTRDADITFIFNKEKYAIEIELGSLLYKKKQLNAKVDYLNKKFPKRWLFVISNKRLVSKYRSFGLASARSEAERFIRKMLGI